MARLSYAPSTQPAQCSHGTSDRIPGAAQTSRPFYGASHESEPIARRAIDTSSLSLFRPTLTAERSCKYTGTFCSTSTAAQRKYFVAGTCVIGLQWGDEAKGKLVDLLTNEFEIVVRFLGGANAGHTVVVGDQTYKLHHIPSGILNPNVINVVTPGVVINPATILKEIDGLLGRGIPVGRNLMLSDRAHVVFPWHLAEDRVLDGLPVGGESIGTTQRGIGPCYRDKVGRSHAIRLGDLYRSDFRERVEKIVAFKRRWLEAMSGATGEALAALQAEAIVAEYQGYAARLEPYVTDTTAFLLDAIDANRSLLFEGAQGSLLDVDHGTYPFVTSSNSSGAGVSAGAGVPASCIQRVIGVTKAYTTRVGGGPFPTEQDNAIGQRIRELGKEYGTTTGRPRRCGWLDAVAVRYTARLSGVSFLALMMLDVLSHLPEIKICTAYEPMRGCSPLWRRMSMTCAACNRFTKRSRAGRPTSRKFATTAISPQVPVTTWIGSANWWDDRSAWSRSGPTENRRFSPPTPRSRAVKNSAARTHAASQQRDGLHAARSKTADTRAATSTATPFADGTTTDSDRWR